MLSLVSKLSHKIKQDVYWLILVASILAIIGAYLAEFALHLQPCILCLYQRIPYLFLITLSIITILIPTTRKYLCFLILLLLMAEIALASYHIGLEHYIFEDSHVCQLKNGVNSTIQDMLSVGEVASSCSEVSFKFMNFSMAEWNLLYAIGLYYLFSRSFRKHK